MGLNPRQAVELFHLQFLRQLAAGGDRARFVLKGGCNLRFFFGSIRYSEDMDVDVVGVPQGTLKNKVDRLLVAPGLLLPLKVQGIEVADVSAPKQTETTQRWKVGLKLKGHSAELRTRVEFSRRERRGSEGDVVAEAIDASLLRAYALPHTIAQHYSIRAAVSQKVLALAGRPETQARDVFDLHTLRPRWPDRASLHAEAKAQLERATERALALGYDDFVAQVVAYLDPEQAAPYQDAAAWEGLQLDVVAFLEELGR